MGGLVIVDAANVVGSVPDGWWRDRHGAAERLRDALAGYAGRGLPGLVEPPVEIVLVVEGAARGVTSVEGVRVESASGSGDDRIVELVRDQGLRRDGEGPAREGSAEADSGCLVVTADRGLRERVRALGARVTGPRAVWGQGGTRPGRGT
ncbi:NTP pyrophosphohydrolase [Streptomyces sp. MST-110588]|uniref:NTP pyrophosphohydrolase n=1 Tax=Streptomyces sp. MST-110588 TaxID=2833628 RepID=UPI001F5C6CAA|nr:NTP pyrophosphohydrolase [Streptomyces sp. MST-110588]UNO39461.1 NTP pyrophosphohydrolase [Streptomyces sp. MST-110588]